MAYDPNELTILVSVSFQFAGLHIEGKTFNMSTPVNGIGLTNAQNAGATVTAEIAKYIGDVATALTTALGSNDSDAAVQLIADQLNQDAATLTTADNSLTTPVNPVNPTA